MVPDRGLADRADPSLREASLAGVVPGLRIRADSAEQRLAVEDTQVLSSTSRQINARWCTPSTVVPGRSSTGLR